MNIDLDRDIIKDIRIIIDEYLRIILEENAGMSQPDLKSVEQAKRAKEVMARLHYQGTYYSY